MVGKNKPLSSYDMTPKKGFNHFIVSLTSIVILKRGAEWAIETVLKGPVSCGYICSCSCLRSPVRSTLQPCYSHCNVHTAVSALWLHTHLWGFPATEILTTAALRYDDTSMVTCFKSMTVPLIMIYPGLVMLLTYYHTTRDPVFIA